MQKNYRTIQQLTTAEIIVDRSKFIASIAPTITEVEARNFVKLKQKKYWDATHNCTAYILASDLMKSSDDGEPSGTAGKPILEVLKNNSLNYLTCVVSRYFGGIKLGTGGLIRAYTQSTMAAIQSAILIEYILHDVIKIMCTYAEWQKIESFLKNKRITYKTPIYTDIISTEIYTLNKNILINNLNHITKGQIKILNQNPEFNLFK